MTVRLDGETIRLEGDCLVEQAEVLVQLLTADRGRSVDVSQCRLLHGAVVQVLLVFRPKVLGAPLDAFVRDHVLPGFIGSAP